MDSKLGCNTCWLLENKTDLTSRTYGPHVLLVRTREYMQTGRHLPRIPREIGRVLIHYRYARYCPRLRDDRAHKKRLGRGDTFL